MWKNLIQKVILFTALSLIIVWSCEEFQPKDYPIDDFDNLACTAFQDSTTKNITIKKLTDFNAAWVDSVVTDFVPNILDSLRINQITITENDTSFTLATPNSIDPCYVHLFTRTNKVVLFSDEFLGIDIIDRDGNVLNAESDAITPETVADCVKEDCEDPLDYFEECVIIKARLVYNLVQNDVLLKITKVDRPERKDTFRVVILPAE